LIISYFCSAKCRFVNKKDTKWYQIRVTAEALQIAPDKAKVTRILLINYLFITKGMQVDEDIFLHNIKQLHREIGRNKILSKCKIEIHE